MRLLFLCSIILSSSITLAKAASPLDLKKEQVKLNDKFQDCCASITPHTITGKKALELYKSNSNVVFIDVREDKEQEVSMIDKAIKASSFDPSKADKSKQYVIYCTIGYRSGKLTKELRDKGLKAFNLEGGIYGWTFENGPINDKHGKTTKKVHVYSKSWNFLRSDFVAID